MGLAKFIKVVNLRVAAASVVCGVVLWRGLVAAKGKKRVGTFRRKGGGWLRGKESHTSME
jgi:hypothetical protein